MPFTRVGENLVSRVHLLEKYVGLALPDVRVAEVCPVEGSQSPNGQIGIDQVRYGSGT